MTRATEKRNPSSVGIDEKSVEEVLRIINADDQRIPAAVERQIPRIAEAVEAVVDTITRGGRVFFVGAGTSGRLGVIEAAEMPATFGVPDHLFQAVIAGGRDAMMRSAESVEDDYSAGGTMLERRGLAGDDVLIALSASGRTPFVIGALEKAKEVGARTAIIACDSEASITGLVDVPVVVEVGPEIVAGSTRMKAGTAQKMALNMITTTAMIKLGMVFDGYMVGVRPTSQKLRERAIRIVEAIAGVGKERASKALDSARGDVKAAIISARTGFTPEEAKRILDQAGGSLRRVLEKGAI